MDGLSASGLPAASPTPATDAPEARGPRFLPAFAGACALGSAHGLFQGAWPFGPIGGVSAEVAPAAWRARRAALGGVPGGIH